MNAASQIVNDYQAAPGKILGCIVYWSLRGFRENREDFRSAMQAMGLEAAVGRPMSASAAMTRALEVWRRGRGWAAHRRLSTGNVALVCFQEEEGSLRPRHVWTVSRDGAQIAEGPDHKLAPPEMATDMRDGLLAALNEVRAYASTADLSEAMTTALQGTRKDPMLASANLRGEAGGVYFVPEAKCAQLDALKNYVESRSASRISRFWITTAADNAEAVQQAVQQTVADELVELRDSVLKFAEECRLNNETPNLKSRNARAKRYDDLSAKVELWSDMLGAVAAEMQAKIAEAKKALADDLNVQKKTWVHWNFEADTVAQRTPALVAANRISDGDYVSYCEELDLVVAQNQLGMYAVSATGCQYLEAETLQEAKALALRWAAGAAS